MPSSDVILMYAFVAEGFGGTPGGHYDVFVTDDPTGVFKPLSDERGAGTRRPRAWVFPVRGKGVVPPLLLHVRFEGPPPVGACCAALMKLLAQRVRERVCGSGGEDEGVNEGVWDFGEALEA